MAFQCKDNCSDCCGVVPIPAETWDIHKDKVTKEIQSTYVMSDGAMFCIPTDLKCAFLHDNKCMIYEDRPDICKLFGTNTMPCPFLNEKGKARSKSAQKRILERYKHDIKQCSN